jgi:hypothetical protein
MGRRRQLPFCRIQNERHDRRARIDEMPRPTRRGLDRFDGVVDFLPETRRQWLLPATLSLCSNAAT